jgi:cation diffusion facilitator family transporter
MEVRSRGQGDPGTRLRETSRAALVSVASNSLLTSAKLVVGFMTGSVSVISEGVHSGNDLVAALLAYFSVRKANEPADEGHGYGHGKYEALSGGIEAGLIIVAALAILYSSTKSLMTGGPGDIEHGPAVLVMGVSAVLNVLVSRLLYRAARKHDSMALKADAAHLSADVLTSVGVFVGLGVLWVVERLGHKADWLDPALALGVAALVLTQGWKIAAEAINQLLDQALPASEVQLVVDMLERHSGRYVSFHRLRSRRSGHQRHLDLHLVVCDQMTVGEAHGLADHLEDEIHELFPNSEVLIHAEPCRNELCAEARRNGTWTGCLQKPHGQDA